MSLNNNDKNNISFNSSNVNNIVDEKKENQVKNDNKLNQKYHENLIILKNIYQSLKKDVYLKKIEYDKEIELKNYRFNNMLSNTYKFFLDKYFICILPVIDCIESSLQLLNKSNNTYIIDINNQLKDINSCFKKFFLEFNISVIDSINVPFDPIVHQAISIDFSGKYTNNYITQIIQKGYMLNKRILRPAMVSVSQSSK